MAQSWFDPVIGRVNDARSGRVHDALITRINDALITRVNDALGLVATMRRARIIAPMRPDRYLKIAAAMRRENMSITSGFAAAAQRCPDRPGFVDERSTLTWRELDERCDAFAAALQTLQTGPPETIGIMCRNHRGFVEALVAANRIGADVLLLNTSFAGPALAEVVEREDVDAVVYDEEFTATIDRALTGRPGTLRIIAWADDPAAHDVTIDKLITAGQQPRPKTRPKPRPKTRPKPRPKTRKGRLILLTSGTTGTPKGATHSGGGPNELKAILDRTPWRAEETTVVVAPMFHAWGFSQLVLSASLACTIVTSRKFDPQATLELIDRHRATGLVVVPVMFDRIMELPEDVRWRYSARSLRFAAASGSRMRPDVVVAFMDQFGDVIYNNYNATEAGMIATATPQDLRAAPDTAGKPAEGTTIRILDERFHELPPGEVGQIFVHNNTQFDGYTSGSTKDFHEGFMASGNVGYLDQAGRLFVVGRDDEMIVSGGENVYPIEVEKTLAAHPEVSEASVIGVDDEQYGQRLAAFVVLEPGALATSDSLKRHVRENLANYKVPRDITVLDELPRSSAGKILRNELKARVADPTSDGG
jgi:acyl-CoA synthetase (AMP-forming)/AMP-acid ligase II